jgi:hypothetical protein
MKRKSLLVLLVVALGAGLYGGHVLATPSSGLTSTNYAKIAHPELGADRPSQRAPETGLSPWAFPTTRARRSSRSLPAAR